jgi:oligoendopeptidase F
MADTSLAGPAWDNSSEYPSITSSELRADIEKANKNISEIESLSASIAPLLDEAETLSGDRLADAIATAQKVSALRQETTVLTWNPYVYANCEISVDGDNDDAKKVIAEITQLGARYGQALQPVTLFLTRISDEAIKGYLDHEVTRDEDFSLEKQRKHRDYLLPLTEENLITGLGVDGHSAWGTLYDDLSGVLQCEVELASGKEKMGIAKASNLLQNADEDIRKAAYLGLQAAWKSQEVACAAILNALAGWRHTVYKKRSHTSELHYLDDPCMDNNIERGTLSAMWEAVHGSGRKVGQNALRAQAHALGKKVLDPWDLMAPAPPLGGGEARTFSFDEGMKWRTSCKSWWTTNGLKVGLEIKSDQVRIVPSLPSLVPHVCT